MQNNQKKTWYGLLLIGILVIGAFVRLAYLNYTKYTIQLQPDSQGYYLEYQAFTDNALQNFFNTNRMPGYTMVTSFLLGITNPDHPMYKSPEFISGTWILIVIQTILGLIGLLILYDTLVAIGVSVSWSLAFTALTAINIYQFIWERALLTEALYITIFTALMRVFVVLLKKPTVPIGVAFIALAIYGFWVRPAGLFVPFVLLPFVWLSHRKKQVLLLVIALLLLYSSVPILHLRMNKVLYNYNGLSINTDFALFGRILHYNIPIDSASSVQPLYDQVQAYRAAGGNITIPWYFFVYYNNEIYSHMGSLQEFNRLVLKNHLPEFAATVVRDIPKAFSDTYVEEVLYRSSDPSVARSFFDFLTTLITTIQKSTIIFLILFPLSIFMYIRKRTMLHTFLLGIGGIEFFQLISTLIFGGAWEYARHMITTQTYLFFFCGYWTMYILRWTQRRVVQ